MSPPSEVLCAGIIVADHVSSPIDHLPVPGELILADQLLLTIGGCAANVAVDLGKLGRSAGVAGCVGDDVFGRVVADMLRERQVDVSALQVKAGVDTSQTLIVNVMGQDRRFIHTFGANGTFQASDVPAGPLHTCRVLYLGGYLLMQNARPAETAELFAAARRAGARTVLDVVTPGPGDYLSWLEPVLPHTDVFLPNNHEAELITKQVDPLRQAEQFHRMGARTAIVTLGEGGSILVTEGLRLQAGVYPVPFVDGTGGGDAFAAGYIDGLLRDLGPEDCLRRASAVGASCVRAIGTTTGVFAARECDEFLARHNLRVERL